MRHLLTAITLFFLVPNLYSQNSPFDAKMIFLEMESKEKAGRVVDLSNGEVAIIRFNSKKKQLYITRYDKDFSIVKEITTPIGEDEWLFDTIEFKDRLEIISGDYKTKNEYKLNTFSLNLETNDVVKKPLYATEKVKGKRKFSWFESLVGVAKHGEGFSVSPNGKFVAFLSDNIDIRTEAYGVIVFDENLDMVFSQSSKANTEDYFELRDFIVTDSAEVIFAGKRYEKGHKEKRKGNANYDYVLHRYTQDTFTSKTIDLGANYYVNDVRLDQSDGGVKMFGLYSEKDTKFVKGTVSYVFNNFDIDIIDKKLSPFSNDAFNDIYTEKKANRLSEKDTELKFYHVNHLLTDSLGGFYLLGEQQWTKTRSYPGGVTEVINFYGNILVVKLDAMGNQLWTRNIFKKEQFTGYIPLVVDNQLHVFLNAGKNLKSKSNNRKKVRTKGFEKMTLFDVAFDLHSGDFDFENLNEKKQRYVGTFPISESTWNGNRLLSRVQWKKKITLLSIFKKEH